MKKYTQLSQFERDRIEALYAAKHSQKDIAQVLKRDKGTISREIKRWKKKNGEYDAKYAQRKSRIKRKASKYQGKKINEDKNLEIFIVEGLLQGWNPDEISGRMKQEEKFFYASKTTIYEWLYSVWGQRYCRLLPSKKYRPKKRKEPKTAGRDMIPNRQGIEHLPFNFGGLAGDLETDTVVSGKKTGSKTALSVIHSIYCHYTLLEKIPSLKPMINEKAIEKMTSGLNNLRGILRDNGIEGKCHELTNTPSFFCDPYSSWQKPHVENTNKLLRRFFPKGCDLGQYSHSYVRMIELILNNKPRKCLGYKKPIEIALENGLISPPKVSQFAININRPLVALRG